MGFGICHLIFIWHLDFEICHLNSFYSHFWILFGVVVNWQFIPFYYLLWVFHVSAPAILNRNTASLNLKPIKNWRGEDSYAFKTSQIYGSTPTDGLFVGQSILPAWDQMLDIFYKNGMGRRDGETPS